MFIFTVDWNAVFVGSVQFVNIQKITIGEKDNKKIQTFIKQRLKWSYGNKISTKDTQSRAHTQKKS